MAKKRKIKRSLGDTVYMTVIYTILTLFGIVTLYPFLNVLAVSLSEAEPVLRGDISVLPRGFNFDAYKSVMQSSTIWTGYKNTLFVVALETFFGVICTAMTAYPLSKSSLPGKKFFLIFVSITIWFTAGMIPRFLVMKNLGLLDSLVGLVLANLITGYNVTVMRNFFLGIPASLEESALLDGCNDMQVLFKIILPLSKPVIATISLWIAVASWNNFFEPMLFISSNAKYTLQIFLRDIVVNANVAASDMEVGAVTSDMIRYATIMVATLPVLCVYPFIQKYFVKGVMVGAVKG